MKFCLRSFRSQLKLSQTQLAELFGVSRSTIGNWESQASPVWVALACRGVRAARIFPELSRPLDRSSLINARAQFGLNQTDFAAKLGVTRATLSRWENGTPPRWIAYAIASLAFKD
jgi:transcriptional regulator with XRE-family HTH domain